MHTGLPENKDLREEMNVKDYNEALDEFLKEAERIVANE
jgi:hypothetical protein